MSKRSLPAYILYFILLSLLVLSVREAGVHSGLPRAGLEADVHPGTSGSPGPAAGANVARRSGSPPKLFWTMEENYHNNGVHPTSGISTDTYVFRIMYYDDDSDDPVEKGVAHLVLDGVDHDMETVDEYFPDGSIFTVSLSDLDTVEHSYYFEFSDGTGSIIFPDDTDMALPVINSRPELTVPRLPSSGGNARKGTVYPAIANSTDRFTFQILYSDIDGHSPSSDKDSRGIYIDNVFYKMVPQQGIGQYYDGNYRNGEMFELETHLPVGDRHSYHFEFEDEPGALGYTEVFEGPKVVRGFPDLRIAWEMREPLITGVPLSEEYADRYDILMSAMIENPSDHSVNEPFEVSFEVFHANRKTGNYQWEETLEVWVEYLYDHSRCTVNARFNARELGMHKVVVTADSRGDILEVVDNNDTKTNNAATHYFKVGPDLSIRTKDIGPTTVFVKRPVKVTAKVYNTGPTTAVFTRQDPLVVSVTIGGKFYEDSVTDPIPPGGFARIIIEFSHGRAEDLVIAVKVDEGDVLPEAAENGTFNNNNVDFKMLTVIERPSRTASPSFGPGLSSMYICLLVLCSLAVLLAKRNERR